jgi:hypothetical protein
MDKGMGLRESSSFIAEPRDMIKGLVSVMSMACIGRFLTLYNGLFLQTVLSGVLKIGEA